MVTLLEIWMHGDLHSVVVLYCDIVVEGPSWGRGLFRCIVIEVGVYDVPVL